MSELRLELHNDGFNEVRRSPALQQELHRRGQKVVDAAGGAPDFQVIDSPSSSRARVIVTTATTAGRKAEATDRALTRAFDAARG